jgi:hypothetical protein
MIFTLRQILSRSAIKNKLSAQKIAGIEAGIYHFTHI